MFRMLIPQPVLGYHITNSQSRYITPTRLKSAQYSLHNNAPSSRKLLKMDVLTSETCWAVNWHNKASVIKLVYLYSNIKMMHGPIRIRFPSIYSFGRKDNSFGKRRRVWSRCQPLYLAVSAAQLWEFWVGRITALMSSGATLRSSSWCRRISGTACFMNKSWAISSLKEALLQK